MTEVVVLSAGVLTIGVAGYLLSQARVKKTATRQPKK